MTGKARRDVLLAALVKALANVLNNGNGQWARAIVNRQEAICNRYGWG
jgi:hypothetical protein